MAKRSLKTHEVSVLRMPGFSAERSLYRSDFHYGSTGVSAHASGVVPQYGNPVPGCFQRCQRQCLHNPYYNACYRNCIYNNCE
jgi:hypothetical protein